MLSKEEQERNGIFINKSEVENIPIVKFPIVQPNPLLRKLLTKEVWEQIRFYRTKTNASINDILSDQEAGISLPDSDVGQIFNF